MRIHGWFHIHQAPLLCHTRTCYEHSCSYDQKTMRPYFPPKRNSLHAMVNIASPPDPRPEQVHLKLLLVLSTSLGARRHLYLDLTPPEVPTIVQPEGPPDFSTARVEPAPSQLSTTALLLSCPTQTTRLTPTAVNSTELSPMRLPM